MRARSVCSVAGCPNLAELDGRCAGHKRVPWAGSQATRRARGVPDRATMRALATRIRRRARNRCESCGAHVPSRTGAVDHRLPVALGGSTSPENLWLLCSDCDDAKTRDDLARIRRAQARGAAAGQAPGGG